MRRFFHLSRRIGLAVWGTTAGLAVSSCWQSNPTCCNADLTSCVSVEAGALACVGGSVESAAQQAAAASNGVDDACEPVAIQGASQCATGTCSTLATGLAAPNALAIDAVNLYSRPPTAPSTRSRSTVASSLGSRRGRTAQRRLP
jgi:hypothetical protein